MRGPYLFNLENREKAAMLFGAIGPDLMGQSIMLKKRYIYPLYLQDVKNPAANILKQTMLSVGGEAVVGRQTINMGEGTTDVLLLGTLKHYQLLCPKLAHQPWGLKKLGVKIESLLGRLDIKKNVLWEWPDKKLAIGEKTLVMGILNITPDSFSDGGRYLNPQTALARAHQMVEEGADIIDVGGESTRPDAVPISEEEELNRVLPILEMLLKDIPVPVSLDTYKAVTAREALKLGVHIINDVGGGKKDPEMARVVTEHNAPVIIMHNIMHEKKDEKYFANLTASVIDDLFASLELYEQSGLSPEKMMLDPGIGFGKGIQGDLTLLGNLEAFKIFQQPVLLGVSRKKFIGEVTDQPLAGRLAGSLSAAAWGVMKGVSVLRVHDVKETVSVVKMLDAIRCARVGS